jgi:hypothetical protein
MAYETNTNTGAEEGGGIVKGPKPPDYSGYSREILEQDFRELHGHEFILRYRRFDSHTGQLDIAATAELLEADVEYPAKSTMLGEGGLRLTSDRYLIGIPKEYEPLAKRYIFGHEAGHILVLEEAAIESEDTFVEIYRDMRQHGTEIYKHIEAFCDYFAAKMIGLEYPDRLPDLGQLDLF